MLSHFHHVRLFVTLWTIARQASLPTGFSGQDYWSGLSCPPPGDLPNPGTELTSLVSCTGRQVLYHYLRSQEYTEELYKKDLHDPDNHEGVITHLEPDILECEVKWALESITMNKASRGD